MAGVPWQPFNGQFPIFPFPMPYWGAASAPPMAAAMFNLQQPLVGSASVSGQPLSGSTGQPGPSSVRGQEEDEDTIQLLDEGESLEFIQFDPKVKDSKKWDAGETINKFLEKHFARVLQEEERLPKA